MVQKPSVPHIAAGGRRSRPCLRARSLQTSPEIIRMSLGWYAYGIGAEPFVVSAVATYVPVLLEELARENAVWIVDKRTPCHEVGDSPGLMPVPIAPERCVLRLGWSWIDTSSLPLYTFSLSVFVQTLLVVSISGLADRGAHRKMLLIGFAVVGALCTIALGYTGGHHYYAAAALAVMGNASFGAVSVCGNAFLPRIVASEGRRLARLRKTAADRFHGAFRPPPVDEVNTVETARISARISGKGTALGYTAALFVQMATMLYLSIAAVGRNGDASTQRLHTVIMVIGWWWLLWQLPVTVYLKTLDPEEEEESNEAEKPPFLAQITYGWSQLWATILRARELRDICTFLLGWFLLSDAVTTINSTAVLFARANLGMATPALALIGLVTVLFAIAGSLAFSRRRNQKQSLVSISLFALVIPAYGVLGFFQPWLGLKHVWEIYALAAWYGLALGALNAATRSLFALLIPEGHEAMFFALYSVTDKGSSVLGPTITGLITDRTHNIRYTFYFLLGMMMLAAYVFASVDFERGQREALAESDSENNLGSADIAVAAVAADAS